MNHVSPTYTTNSFSSLAHVFLVTSSSVSNTDLVESNETHISVDLLVTHYTCSQQQNLPLSSFNRFQPFAQAPSSFEKTRVLVNVFLRSKTKCPKAWTCEAYVRVEKSMFSI